MKRIFSSIWFLALLITIPVIFLLPDLMSKYLVKQESIRSNQLKYPSLQVYYQDLDNDGTCEIIEVFQYKNMLSFQYFTSNGGLIGQVNFKGAYNKGLHNLFFNDLDGNGFSEIIGLTLASDSVLINIVEPSLNCQKQSYFLTKVQDKGVYKTIDPYILETYFYDFNSDGTNEIIACLDAGFSLVPRGVAIFDYATKSVIQSEFDGSTYSDLVVKDINGDYRSEIIVGGLSPNNVPDTMTCKLDDNHPYLKVFDQELNPLIEPVQFPEGIGGRIQTHITVQNEIFTLFKTRGKNQNPLILYKLNPDGKKTDSLIFNVEERLLNNAFIKNEKDEFWINVQRNEMTLVDTGLNLIQTKKLNHHGDLYVILDVDINEDGIVDYLMIDRDDGRIFLFTDKFDRHYEVANLKQKPISGKISRSHFYLFNQNFTYTYSFRKNPLYPLRFLIYMLIYFASVGVFWLLQLIQTASLKEKYELQNQVRNMELKSLQGQMDPHFVFNSFTTMASLLKTGEQEQAYNAFLKFSKLIRSNFDFTSQIARPLKEELSAVTHFLEINKMRFKEKLDFEIDVAGDVSMESMVPKMMLQIHVENALKHGLAKSGRKGEITIKVWAKDNYCYFSVKDNGIGRKKAAEMKQPSTRQGLKMLNAIYEQINQKNKSKIIQHFTDLRNETGEVLGTLVEIKVPVDLKE